MANTQRNDEPLYFKAAKIVDRAIAERGEVASLPTNRNGNIRSFEDTISPAIYEGYLALALSEVDLGNWETAYDTARTAIIDETLRTLTNQA